MTEDEDQKVVDHYQLSPHPEGGWFRRTYSSPERVLLERGERLCGSSIYYFLKNGEKSRLHSLKSDEIWYFHFGSPVRMHLFSDSDYYSIVLGQNWKIGEVAQYEVSAGVIFGAELLEVRGALMSCSVCPGFNDNDFQWALTENLALKFPRHSQLISRLQSNRSIG
ncbi:cupin domain-containing protein [Opitutales bacterium]|nr:cupin domain-containing protein [Opitutales bacterium]